MADDVLTLAEKPDGGDGADDASSVLSARSRSSLDATTGAPPSFTDSLLFLCNKQADDDRRRLSVPMDGSFRAAKDRLSGFADDVGAAAITALEQAEDSAVPYLKFKNTALRDHVANIMSSSKRGALEEAMAAWRDSVEIGLTVARQVRKAESSFLRTFKSVASGIRRRATGKKAVAKMTFGDADRDLIREHTANPAPGNARANDGPPGRRASARPARRSSAAGKGKRAAASDRASF